MENTDKKKPEHNENPALPERPARRKSRSHTQKQKRSAKRLSVLTEVVKWSFKLTAGKFLIAVFEAYTQSIFF